MASNKIEIWYLLVDQHGQPYKGTSQKSVKLAATCSIDAFREKVKYANPNKLASIAASYLKVFKDRSAFENAIPLYERDSIAKLELTDDATLIVLVPDAGVWIRKRQKTEWKTTESVKVLKYDPKSVLFELNSNYLADTGLPSSQKLVLYCRPLFHQQFKFLKESVIDNSRLGWILGSPGTGKSTTALAFASTLDSSEWVITWIHLSRSMLPMCVRYDNGTKKIRIIKDINFDDLDEIYDEVKEDRKHIIFVDGYTLAERHLNLLSTCHFWLKQDRNKRRLVIVCSLSSRGKTNMEEDYIYNVEEFFVYSWKLEEYLAAVEHDAFFNNVNHFLDSVDNLQFEAEPISRADMINSKFYFAGGCARFMFLFETAKVIEFLKLSVTAVNDIIPYVTGTIGHESNAVINRLFSHYENPYDDFLCTSIVSAWAASRLAIKCGPGLIQRLADAVKYDRNPSMDSWMFEMWFFASLRNGGIKLYDENGNEIDTWPQAIVDNNFDISKFPSLDAAKWLKPIKWNQGGYDTVFIDKEQELIRFVQVTRSDSHSFKIQYFWNFLNAFLNSSESFEIKNLEIVFLVLKEKVAEFTLSEVSGEGLLSMFGWRKGDEKNKIIKAGISGWD